MFGIPFMGVSAPADEAALDASAESFVAFYDRALPRIYGYFLHRCGGSAPTAEDLTQETFLAAIAELKKGRKVAAPMAWIYGIARHKLLDHYRSHERLARPLAGVPEVDPPEDEPRSGDGEEAREHVVAALAAVAASQRAALVLCYMDGYSVPETARLLGKSVEAVESLLARGRQGFKRAYREELR